MSVALTTNPSKPHTVQDDLESFFHVLLYMILHYFKHYKTTEWVSSFIHNYFNAVETYDVSQPPIAGTYKRTAMRTGTIDDRPFLPVCDENHPISQITCQLLKWFKAYYNHHFPRASYKDADQTFLTERTGAISEEDLADDLPSSSSATPETSSSLAGKVPTELDSHRLFAGLLARHLQPSHGFPAKWPDNDLVGDQFRPEFHPDNGRTRSTLYTTTATKRARDFESHLNEQPSQTQSADEPTSRSKRRKTGAQSTGSGA